MIISSSANHQVKRLRKAFQGGWRTESGRVYIEGLKLLREAIHSGLSIDQIFVSHRAKGELDTFLSRSGLDQQNVSIVEISDRVFSSVSDTENPQGVIAVAKLRAHDTEVFFSGQQLLLFADGLQDPGNLGTLFRSAEAFGVSGMLIARGSVCARNPKVVRSSAGSVFRLPWATDLENDWFTKLRQHQFNVVAATPWAKISFLDVEYRGRTALIVGNEAHGISKRILDQTTVQVRIPMRLPVESLNVSVAASIILCEMARQRQYPAR